MTIQPRDVLQAFSPKFKRLPPPRFTEDDSLLIEIRDKIAKAENVSTIRHALVALLRESLAQMVEENNCRTNPEMVHELYKRDDLYTDPMKPPKAHNDIEEAARTGLIGVLSSECEFAKSE
jgi:hypothetical protein